MRPLLIALASLNALGCGAFAGTAAESAVDESIEELAQPEEQRRIASVLADPEIQRATGDLVAAVLDAAMRELTSDERQAVLEDALASYTAVVGSQLGASVTRAVTQELEGAFDGSSMAPEQLQQLSASVAEGITRGMATGLREDLGPAMAAVIREDVAQAVDEAFDERLRATLGDVARTMAREAVIGASEAMQAEGRRGSGVRSSVRGFLDQGEDVAQWLVVAVTLLVVFAVLAIAALVVAARRARREARQQRSALTTMVDALRRTEGREWSPELHAILREAYEGHESPELVRSILREDPSLGSRVRKAAERAEAKEGIPPHRSPA